MLKNIEYKNFKIIRELNEDGIYFEIKFKDNLIKLPLNTNKKYLKSIINSDFIEILYKIEDLWLLEVIDNQSDGYVLRYEKYINLNKSHKKLLHLPVKEVTKMEIKDSNIITNKNFDISLNCFYNQKDISFLSKTIGPIIHQEEDFYYLNQNMFKLKRIVNQFKKSTSHDKNSNALLVAKLKKIASEDSKIVLSNYLRKTDYLFPEDMNLRIIDEEESIKLIPEFSNLNNADNELINKKNKKIISKGVGTKRRRIIFDNDTYKNLQEGKKIGEITGEDVPRFFENPMQYIPEELDINLDEFSDRVKGLKKRIYKMRTIVEVDDNENGWLVNINHKIETIDSETQEIISPLDFEKILKEASKNNKDYIYYKGKWIKVPKYNKKAKKIVKKFSNQGKVKKKFNFIFEIFENVEGLEYSEKIINYKEIFLDEEIKQLDESTLFNGDLYDYQKEGYSWLVNQDVKNFGSLLADDMGLGKTIQVISYLAHIVENNDHKPTLIVVPATLIDNWINEIRKFLDYNLDIYRYKGRTRIKDKNYLKNKELVITSYGTLRVDQVELGRIDWRAVIIDEAQKIKNTSTYITNAVKAMKAENKIALTGTPVENNLSELWSIIDFIQPGYLGSLKEYRKYYSKEIKHKNYEVLDELTKKIKPIFMRRNKKDILSELPEKYEKKVFVEMTSIQKDIYHLIVEKAKSDKRQNILKYINYLVQISSHSLLVEKNFSHEISQLYDGSNKLKKIIELLKEIKTKNEKAIIFTRYIKMQSIIRKIISEEFNISPSIINGELSANRQSVVDNFNNSSGFNVMILSPKAAGVGLNITGANHVIHYTREWNPAVENQATDRAYRIGQEKDVYVYYLITKLSGNRKSADEKIDLLLDKKRKLFENTIIPSAEIKITSKDFENIFQ